MLSVTEEKTQKRNDSSLGEKKKKKKKESLRRVTNRLPSGNYMKTRKTFLVDQKLSSGAREGKGITRHSKFLITEKVILNKESP